METACFISHDTALAFWRQVAQGRLTYPDSAPAAEMPSSALREEDLFSLRHVLPHASAFHVVVRTRSLRRHLRGVSWHVWEHGTGAESFFRISANLYVPSPEFLFVQMASRLPFIELLQLGFELCGCYVMEPMVKQGFESTNRPLTTPKRLEAFLSGCPACRGVSNAKRALGYLLGQSFSPMESDVALMLTLPVRMGGLQLPKPLLNVETYLPRELTERAGTDYYRLDFYWPEYRLALEYDSRQEHSDRLKSNLDKKRVEILQQMGITVKTLTELQVFRQREFDTVYRGICAIIGRRYRQPSPEQVQMRMQLRFQLFKRLGDNLLIG